MPNLTLINNFYKKICLFHNLTHLTFTTLNNFQTATEKKTGQTCVFHMKRFVDLSGTFKIVATLGMEKFASAMGKADDENKKKH